MIAYKSCMLYPLADPRIRVILHNDNRRKFYNPTKFKNFFGTDLKNRSKMWVLMEGIPRKFSFYFLHKPTSLGLVISPKIKNFWLSSLILPNFLSVYMRGSLVRNVINR